MTVAPLTLGDLGERRLIQEILGPRYHGVERFGDDSAVLPPVPPGHRLVATTDPCPEPVASILGYDDPYYRGWLLATINLSDLAAAGGAPLGLLTSLVLPRELTVDHFSRLLDGIDDACAVSGTHVVGGNLKEGPRADLTATAIGSVLGMPFSRKGCGPGDHVVVVGELGAFWAGALDVMHGLGVGAATAGGLLRNVLTPRAKTAAALALHATGVVTAAMDNSDGLASTLETIADTNDVGIRLNLRDDDLPAPVRMVADRLDVDAMRLVFGWGDWHLVVCVRGGGLDAARAAVEGAGEDIHVLGTVTDSVAEVRATYGTATGILEVPRSERFAAESWFTTGLASYVERLTTGPFLR